MRRWALACALPALAVLLAAAATPARADLRVDGRGFGHGIGMSQYGAYGYALEEHRSYRWILRHYYPGTRLARTRAYAIRVKLRSARVQTVCSAVRAVDARGRRVRLHQDRDYRVQIRHGRLRFRDESAHRTKAELYAPVTVSGGRDFCLRGRADNGVEDGAYRGALVLAPDGNGVLAVNRLSVERYLYGVVASEMPSGWPLRALEAQAVAARTYALGARRAGAPFDVFSDTRSQVYRGIRGESLRAVRAVHATSRRVVTYRGRLAQTYFFSTSGGRTADIDQVWGVPAVPYLHSVSDPYDYLSPVHTWSVRFSERELRRRLGSLVPGRLRGVRVIARGPAGRVKLVELEGSRGTEQLSGGELRTRLGLRSTWFRLRRI